MNLSPMVHMTMVFLHVLGAILFMGNIVVSAMWMAQAKRAQSAAVLQYASRSLMRADRMFTIPGIVLIVVPGILAMGRYGGFGAGAAWAELALALFIVSGLMWGFVLLRLQRRMIDLSTAAVEAGREVDPAFHDTLKKWNMWGGIATLLPFVALILMVYKPRLWS